jgi:hypothetical protein
MLKYLVISFFNLLLVTISLGQSPVQINQPYKFNSWISVRDSLRSARGIYDLTLQLPTGCGGPSGITSLNGGDRNRSAFFYDSCNGKLFVFNPKNLTWESTVTRAAGSAGQIQFHSSTDNGFQATSNFKYDPMFGFLTLGQPGLGQINMSPQGYLSLSNAEPALGANVFLSNSDGYGLDINMNGPSAFGFPSNAHIASAKGLILSGVDSTRISSTPATTSDCILGVINQEGTYGTGKLVRIPKPTWAQTLAASADLTASVYSDGSGNSFIIDNTSDFALYALDPGTNNFSAVEGYSGFTGLTAQNDATNGQASISANAGDGDVPNFQFHTSLVGSSNRASDWLGQADGYNMINVHNNPAGRKSFFEQFATDSITGHRLTTYHTNGYNRFSITDTLFKFECNRSDLANLDFRLINLPRSTSNTDSVLVKDAAGRIYSRSQSDISGKPREFMHWSQWLMNNISGTTFELSCLREGAGSVTIPKNTAVTGDTYRITIMGDVSTDAITPGQLTLRIKIGDQLVATTNAFEIPAGINQRGFEVDVIVTFWIPSSVGLAYGRGFWKDESGAMKRFDNGNGFAQLDFTNDLDWNITAQWSNDSMGNAVRPFIVSIVQEN